MTDEHREAYNEMIELIQDAGYIVVKEEFSSDSRDPEFNADLWVVPPDTNTDPSPGR